MPQPFDKNNSEDWREIVNALVKSVKYGSVQIVIQDGKVVQIDSTEKIRLDQPQDKGGSDKKQTPPSGK